MADKKISALTAASTPLAGTEVLPIVQSGATVKVSVDNLIAGRDISTGGITANGHITGAGGDVRFTDERFVYSYAGGSPGQHQSGIYLDGSGLTQRIYLNNAEVARWTDGNLKIATAGKGIDFSSDSHAAGMTSQLLNAYEEGTWSPVYKTDGTNFPSITMDTNCAYTRVGRQVTVTGRIRTDAINTTGATGNVYVELPFTPSKAAGAGISNSYEFASNYPSSVYCDANSNRLYLMRKLALNSQDVNVYAADMFNGTNANKNQIDVSFTFFV